MKALISLLGAALITVLFAIPAFALEDGILETSSVNPSPDGLHADFEHVLTNVTEDPIEVAPRDLRRDDFILTVVEITVGTFDSGIWTIGTLDGGQTARITYLGDAPPTTTTTLPTSTTTTTTSPTVAPVTTSTVADTTTTTAAPTTTAPPAEELPYTGSNEQLGVLAIVGLALVGLGTAMVRTSRS